jgi:DNA-binding protein YbaB
VSRGDSKVPQGGGELSGLLRHAEALQRQLDQALVDLKSEVIEAQDAGRLVTIKLTGDGGAQQVQIHLPNLSEAERKALQDALLVALRLALERMFELRKKRSVAVTKGLSLPGLFS